MKKIILITTILFLSCQKKETNIKVKPVKEAIEKGEYFSHYTKKESSVLKNKTDTLSLFYDGNQLNRVEIKFYSESLGGDGTSAYARRGYHINKEFFLDANVSITDTLQVNDNLDYPIIYEEDYEFFRKNHEITYSFDGKKISNYFKSNKGVSSSYIYYLVQLDAILSKISLEIEKFPKSLYNITKNDDELYASQDSITVYDIKNTNSSKKLHSSIPFNYLRDIKIKKVGNTIKYFAKISLKKEGYKYIDLKEIEGIQSMNPHLEEERFAAVTNGLALYGNTGNKFFGDKDNIIAKIPMGGRVQIRDTIPGDLRYVDGKKGYLITVYYETEDERLEGVVFGGHLSINK
jgi:hypothetical protein